MREEERKLNHRNAGRKKTYLQGALENNIFVDPFFDSYIDRL
jgi:hypothetical protein